MKIKRRNSKTGLVFVNICLWCLCVCAACSGRPGEVLSEDRMVSLMVDMEIAEAYSQQTSITNADKVELGKRVLAAHDVSAETLDTTLAWYGRNLDEYARLFEKVDKEINKRKNKYIESPAQSFKDLANLWPYGKHMVLSRKDDGDALVFSLLNPGVEKGQKINMMFALPNLNGGKGELGVEYEDGTGEIVSTNFNNKNHVDLILQSDTTKVVSRLFGSLWFKDRNSFPVFIDSLSLTVLPLDTLEYRQKKRTQKSYGKIVTEKKVMVSDSVSSFDSGRK